MSYGIWLKSPPCPRCGRCGDEPNCPDPTYNLTGIFHLALTGEDQPSPEVGVFDEIVLHKKVAPRGLKVLDGRVAGVTIDQLEAALQRLRDPDLHDRFVALEPENKWGTVPDAAHVLQMLLTLAREFKDNVWSVR